VTWQLTVEAGLKEIVLPDGLRHQGGDVIVLSDAQYSILSAHSVATLFSSVTQTGGGGGGGGTLDGYIAPAVVPLTFGSSIAVDAASGNVFTVSLTASTGTIENPSSPVDGQVIRFRITQDSTGGRTVAWGSAFDWGTTSGSANSAPTLTAGALKTDEFGFEYDAALTKWVHLSAPLPQGF
jgi:hypothetical protein